MRNLKILFVVISLICFGSNVFGQASKSATKVVEADQTKEPNKKDSIVKEAKSNDVKSDVKKVETKASEVKKADIKKGDKMSSSNVQHPTVVIKTNLGAIKVKLNKEKAPVTVQNFLTYVNNKFYNDTVFHRVIDGFMIQGGGFAKSKDGITQKPTGEPIKIESKNGLSNKKGTIAMARTSDPNSATSQFFINVVDNTNLDYPKPDGHGYTVFGEVVDEESMMVVNKIRQQKTTTKPLAVRLPNNEVMKQPMPDVPAEDVVIESVALEN